MIEQRPIIPIEQRVIYCNGIDANTLEGQTDLQSPVYLLDWTMRYAEIKVMVCHIPAET